jgi:hypothetical protein
VFGHGCQDTGWMHKRQLGLKTWVGGLDWRAMCRELSCRALSCRALSCRALSWSGRCDSANVDAL